MINLQHGDSHAAICMCYAIDACRDHHGGSLCVQATWHMPTHGIVEQCSVADAECYFGR